jgi:serine/threonine-protein kinase
MPPRTIRGMVDDRDRDDRGIPEAGDTAHDASTPTLGTPPQPIEMGATLPFVAAAPAAEAAPAADLDGSRYRLLEVLGKGGMGEVVLAFDQQIGREVAVKRIRSERPSAEEVARFVREARVQGRLEHPAVVPVHDLAVDRTGTPFFVMKRLAGTDLRELLERLRPGSEPDQAGARRRLLRAFVDVCLAVEFAHSRNIVHRDLKPANIMLGDFGEVYVLDWGIARTLDGDDGGGAGGTGGGPIGAGTAAATAATGDTGRDPWQTRPGAILGTPAYMAPEQLAGAPAGPGADIYALGCILREIAPGVPELDAIGGRATASDPAARLGSARALGTAVQAFLDGDRDLAARKELARHHLEEARAALTRGDDAADRRTAMRAAGRALALDPAATEAAELVTRLMIEPPRRAPDEVEHLLEVIDTATAKSQGRLGAIAMTGYLAFLPLLLWTGVRDPDLVVAFAVMAVLAAAQVYAMTRRDRIPRGGIYASACINAVLIALVCRLVGPFVIAPTLVLTTLMAFAVHPRFGRIEIVAAILTLGVAVPWLLEAAGALAPTYHFEGGSLVLTSPVVRFSEAPVQLAFAAVLLALVAITAVLLRSMATRQRDATRRIELRAWQLRQLVR